MEEQSITLTATISFWSHYRATRAVVNRLWSTYVAWGFFVGVPFVFIIIMLCSGQDIFAPGNSGLPAWTILLGGLLFMVALMPLLQMFNVSSLRRRNPSVGGVQTYTIAQEGYTVQGGLFNNKLKWEAFFKATETKEFFLLYLSTRWAQFIPKATATADELKTIRTILREKFGAKAKLLSS